MITVLRSGLVIPQDFGRVAMQSIGVPLSGALDKRGYTQLYKLMGSPIQFTSLEILSGEFTVKTDSFLLFAVVGDATIKINGGSVPMNQVLHLLAGDVLSISLSRDGIAYVGFDGLECQKTLGSSSFDSMNNLGLLPIHQGDILYIDETRFSATLGDFLLPNITRGVHTPFRIIPFDDSIFDMFISRSWSVASFSRSGVRLTAKESTLEVAPVGTIPSIPVSYGTLQMPNPNEAIILGPDSGVTGGYPVAGVIATVDLPKIGLLREGTVLKFQSVFQDEAYSAYQEEQRYLAHRIIHASHF